ncbi:fluoride efflux transporter FluC [Bailinhaonella thermotolerans]|uniref:fluoride efflux transporter FluC n=1 Tax=Bailinhaonella thermotolerans TaxID=1070861 RepID=UPI001F5BF14E|nr:CrcB family protein [Bailinhaonella thermotolerans]
MIGEEGAGPVDPDVEPRAPAGRGEVSPAVLGAVALGGLLGGLARYGVAQGWPAPAGGWPWPTLAVNVAGSLLIGVLMAVLAGGRAPHPLARPFLGTGFLGGFTTFSAYALEIGALAERGRIVTAAAYLVVTAVAAVAAAWAGSALARAAVRRRRTGRSGGGA